MPINSTKPSLLLTFYTYYALTVFLCRTCTMFTLFGRNEILFDFDLICL